MTCVAVCCPQSGSADKIVTDQLLSKEQYDHFRTFLEESCGIVLGDNKHYLVTSRLNRLTKEFSFNSLNSMIDALRNKQDAEILAFGLNHGYPESFLGGFAYHVVEQIRAAMAAQAAKK